MQRVKLNTNKLPKAKFPTRFGNFEIKGFENVINGEQAIALQKGEISSCDHPLVRIHSQCFTGDTLHSFRCDCGDQLEHALRAISEAEAGILIYQMQEGRGIGLINKLMAYQLQDQGIDTVEANLQLGFDADERDYEFCAEILKFLGVSSVRLMSNNPDKIRALESYGIAVEERVPLIVQTSPVCRDYMMTKKVKMGHLL
jgi:3,4-dihydroxy 2-butanone 4-phosphate synthase/GTP cyclohydrolase II